MFTRLASAVLALTVIFPSCIWADIPHNSVMAIKANGRTFCTVFSIHSTEGNWASAGHCAVAALELMEQDGADITIGDFPAHVAFIDPLSDTAVFQSDYKAKAVEFSKELPEVGDKVVIVGYPYGLTKVVTEGIVGARNIPIMHPTYKIQLRSDILDVTVAGGNSGSPVFNKDGKIVGILWGGFVNSPHSLSVPLESVRRALDGFME